MHDAYWMNTTDHLSIKGVWKIHEERGEVIPVESSIFWGGNLEGKKRLVHLGKGRSN